MAVQGDNSELPLPDLMGMLRFRTGVVRFTGVQNMPETEMHVSPGYLRALFVQNRSITHEVEILDKLVAITASPEGRFNFYAQTAIRTLVNYSLDGMILAVVTNIDEILAHSDKFAHSDQVFSFVEGREELANEDDPTLSYFLRHARDQLEIGITVDDLATLQEMSPRQVQFYLLKLSRLGMLQIANRKESFASIPQLSLKSTGMRLADAHFDTHGAVAKGAETDPAKFHPVITKRSHATDIPPQGRVTRLI